MIRLVYCIPSLCNPGGMERVLTYKVNYLASTGQYAITVITIEQAGKPVYYPLHESIRLVDLDVDFKAHFKYNLLVKTWCHNRQLWLYKRRLANYLQLNPVDICISLCGKEVEFMASLQDRSIKMAELHFNRDYKKQFVTATYSGKVGQWLGNYLTYCQDQAIKKLAHLVVLSKADEQAWCFLHGRVSQIYNPVEPKDLVETLNCPKKIIAVGRLEYQKGFDYLIDSWSLVIARHPDWTLHIWGEGNCRKQLEKMIAERHLEACVCLKGTTNVIEHEYQTSYAMVMASRYEGLPMALLEAMTCRLPLVSFDCPCGPSELIREGENGFLVPVGDCNALAERLCRLIEDPALREKMAAASLDYSSQYHTETIMKQWMELFDLLLKKNN